MQVCCHTFTLYLILCTQYALRVFSLCLCDLQRLQLWISIPLSSRATWDHRSGKSVIAPEPRDDCYRKPNRSLKSPLFFFFFLLLFFFFSATVFCEFRFNDIPRTCTAILPTLRSSAGHRSIIIVSAANNLSTIDPTSKRIALLFRAVGLAHVWNKSLRCWAWLAVVQLS